MSRPSDFIARYGGEEFMCILPNTDAEGEKNISEELIEKVQRAKIVHEKSPDFGRVTVSIGFLPRWVQTN